jgi:hypothetical protein
MSQVCFPAEVSCSADLQSLLRFMLCKDPAGRATLQHVMSHDWTTERGEAPLPCLRSLLTPPKLVEVSRTEAQTAIARTNLVSLIRARLKEKMFTPGELLFRCVGGGRVACVLGGFRWHMPTNGRRSGVKNCWCFNRVLLHGSRIPATCP